MDKFDTAQPSICLPNILLTPRAPIHGKIGWFLNKCILKHSSLLVSGYWVYGCSSYAGLIGRHPPPPKMSVSWVWRSADLNWFWRSGSYMGVTIQYTGGGCLRPLQLSWGPGQLNTKPRLVCIVRLLYSMDIVCKSDDVHQQKTWKGLNLRIDFWPLLL